ncbi:hypothetical protein DFH08DRAFT_942312 [Mycena albidolilacea]|uniref:Uncharacterized protein n=1 Tax=Mycena albidolilacea TaxID=1033008 RepID=A0AAD6ZF81_9AGAR|nr:hypothetical protein DFH08DRAFT_942312 [Mycena albidolilacea]
MDNPPDESAGFSNNLTSRNRESRPGPHGSGMFTGSQNFTVTGHTFNNITNQYTASVPSDFRMIPLGDIDLQHEIQVDRGVLGRWRRRGHPNIVQIYGTASSNNIHATLFHDGRLSPFLEFLTPGQAARDHVYFTFQQPLLCAELIPPSTLQPALGCYPTERLRSHRISSALDTELMVVESLTMEEYHNICVINLSQSRMIFIPTSTTVNPDYPLKGPVEIAYMPNVDSLNAGWHTSEGANGTVMEDGWTRDFSTSFKSDNIFNGMMELRIWCPATGGPWFSQANHIFCRLQIMSNFNDYGATSSCYYVFFKLEVSGTTKEPPAGFLFLCPQKDFKTSPSSFHWPDCPAYWSLDPSGTDRLGIEEAIWAGFPAFWLTTTLLGHSWDTGVYEGLRKFHQGKGFDSNSLDLARHLQYPLYELSAEADSTFAHVNEGDFEEVDQEDLDAESRAKSDNTQTEASVSEDVDNIEGSHAEENDHDLNSVCTACGSDHFTENQEPPAPDTTSIAENRPDSPALYAEMLVLSGSLRVLIAIQLVLIIFLGLSGLYEHK